jgi:hypothetical protein
VKKSFWNYLLLLSLISMTGIYACPAYSQQGKNVGIANSVEGIVNNYHQGAPAPERMETGSKVYLNDRILTEKESKVQIVFRDDSVITIGPESELSIDVNVYDEKTERRESVLSLAKGRVRSVVSKSYSRNNSRFEIHTRTATAGVRGTENAVETTENPPDTTVFGIRDTTTTQSTDPNFPDQYPVGPNNGARFPEGQEPQLFEFEFDDPAFLEVIGDTTIPGSDDIEDDVEMGALGTNPPDDFQPPEGPEQEIDDLITPPFEQEIEPEPEDEDNHYHDGYDGMGFGMGP